jgi:hypothetical protein
MRSLLVGIVVALVVLVCVALYFHWIDVSADRSPGTTSEVTVKLHEGRAKEDLREAGHEVSQAARKVGEEVREGIKRLEGEHTVKGTLQSVDPATGTIVVKPEGGVAMTVELTDSTKIRVGDKPGNRDDLKAGENVTCTHKDKDGKHVCQSLTIELTK